MISREGSKVSVDHTTKSIGVEFVGPDGRRVSIAFDGRCDRDNLGGGISLEEYFTYSDCPVMVYPADSGDCADPAERGKQSGVVSDLQAMQLLRDALIAMDLGKFEDRVACNECSVEFVPALRSYYNVCDACKAREDEMECAVCEQCGAQVDTPGWTICNDCSDYE
jgi:hypothetical protein